MNSMIENLVIDMRALGIKSLALELSDDSGPPAIASPEDRATLAPDDLPPVPPTEVEPEFAASTQCAEPGCGEEPGGVLGGKMKHLCRKHAFARMGIK